jgi:DNA-binding transcriptional ArsR family regulator
MTAAPTHKEEPPRLQIREAGVMRALAHQARLAILEHLLATEVATATECAAICGLSPSATSYHLRALAKAGLVEEAPSRGDARERLWRSAVRGFEVEPLGGPDADLETREAERELVDAYLIRDETRSRQWIARREQAPPDWQRAAGFNEAILNVTAAELTEITKQIHELLRPYGKRRRAAAPADARTVSMLIRAIPTESFEES